MLSFQIPNMTCGHCVKAVTQAVHAVDPAATVQTDLASHEVKVETTASRESVVAQLAEAGYQPA